MNGTTSTKDSGERQRVHMAVQSPSVEQGTGIRADRGRICEQMGQKHSLSEMQTEKECSSRPMHHMESSVSLCKVKREAIECERTSVPSSERGSVGQPCHNSTVQKQEVHPASTFKGIKKEQGWSETREQNNTGPVAANINLHQMEQKKAIEGKHSIAAEKAQDKANGGKSVEARNTNAGMLGSRGNSQSKPSEPGMPGSSVHTTRPSQNEEMDERIVEGRNGQKLFVLGGAARRTRFGLGPSGRNTSISTGIRKEESDVCRRGGGDGDDRRIDSSRRDILCKGSDRPVSNKDMHERKDTERKEGNRQTGTVICGSGGDSMALQSRKGGIDHRGSVSSRSDIAQVQNKQRNDTDRLRQPGERDMGKVSGKTIEQRDTEQIDRDEPGGREHSERDRARCVRFTEENTKGCERDSSGDGDEEESGDINVWLRSLSHETMRSEGHGKYDNSFRNAEKQQETFQTKARPSYSETDAYRSFSAPRIAVRGPGRPPKPKDNNFERVYKEGRKSHRLPPGKRGNKKNSGCEDSKQWWEYDERERCSAAAENAPDECLRVGAGRVWLNVPERFSGYNFWDFERSKFKRLETACKMMGMPYDFTSNEERLGEIHTWDETVKRKRENEIKYSKVVGVKKDRSKKKKRQVLTFAEKYGLPIVRSEIRSEENTKIIAKEQGFISVIDMPHIYKGMPVPNVYNREPIQIVNITVTFNLNVVEIDKLKFAALVEGAFYNRERFKSVMFSFTLGDIASQPNMIALISHTGRVVLPGSRSKHQALEGAQRFVSYLRDKGVIPTAEVHNFNVENIVACADIGHLIDLTSFTRDHPTTVEWHPERFPPALFRPGDEKRIALIYASGKFVVAGAKDEDEIRETCFTVYQKGEQYKASPGTSFTSSDLRLVNRQIEINDINDYNDLMNKVTGNVSDFSNMLENVSLVAGDGINTIAYGNAKQLLGTSESAKLDRDLLITFKKKHS